jgi:hypothetical protein
MVSGRKLRNDSMLSPRIIIPSWSARTPVLELSDVDSASSGTREGLLTAVANPISPTSKPSATSGYPNRARSYSSRTAVRSGCSGRSGRKTDNYSTGRRMA